LQNAWVAWVAQGFPAPPPESNVVAAAAEVAVPPMRDASSASTFPPQGGSTSAVAAIDPRRARPAPNLIYHIHDKGPSELPAAGGLQTLARPADALAAPPSQNAAQNAAPTSVPQPLPAEGWRTADGAPAESGRLSEATTSQVARPPTMEPSRQVILEWQQH
jgi:hypothetical protein